MSKKPAVESICRTYFGQVSTDEPQALPSRDLTPVARFILGETKKRLGQHGVSGALAGDEAQIDQLVRDVESERGEELSAYERAAAVAALKASRDHFDILSPLFGVPGVNDIIVRSYDDISIQTGRQNTQTDLRFPDPASYAAFIENLLKRVGKSCTLATPVVDAALDGNTRICVTHESFSPPGSGPMLTVRIARHARASLEQLAHQGLAPLSVLEYLGALVRSGAATVLICGEVGSGKTTLVRALTTRIDESESILCIEDTHELVLNRRFVRTLLTREANTEGSGRIAPAQAIRTGMRMAMNRVILGEMRDAEAAEAFIDVCASGHAGISTIHARSAKDALQRLELFLLRAQGSAGIDTVRRQIANAVSVVVHLGIDPQQRKRRVLSILEVGTAADGAIQTSPLLSFVATTAEWHRQSGLSLLADILKEQAVPLPPLTTRCEGEGSRYHG